MKTDRARHFVTARAKAVDQAARTITHWISRESVDRAGDVLLAEGCESSDYMANPVVLWAHDQSQPPIARCLSLQVMPGDGVEAVTQFAETDRAEEVWQLYQAGIMTAWSVGYRTIEERNDDLRPGQKWPTTVRWSLLEYSAVPVPCNAGALVKAALDGNQVAAEWTTATFGEVDLAEVARIEEDAARAIGALTGLRNIGRHFAKADQPYPLRAELLAELKALASELFDQAPDLVDDPTPAPEPDPDTVGDPSDQAVMECLQTITTGLKTISAQQREIVGALTGQASPPDPRGTTHG